MRLEERCWSRGGDLIWGWWCKAKSIGYLVKIVESILYSDFGNEDKAGVSPALPCRGSQTHCLGVLWMEGLKQINWGRARLFSRTCDCWPRCEAPSLCVSCARQTVPLPGWWRDRGTPLHGAAVTGRAQGLGCPDSGPAESCLRDEQVTTPIPSPRWTWG